MIVLAGIGVLGAMVWLHNLAFKIGHYTACAKIFSELSLVAEELDADSTKRGTTPLSIRWVEFLRNTHPKNMAPKFYLLELWEARKRWAESK